jgi:hypothetical protein
MRCTLTTEGVSDPEIPYPSLTMLQSLRKSEAAKTIDSEEAIMACMCLLQRQCCDSSCLRLKVLVTSPWRTSVILGTAFRKLVTTSST